MFKKLKDKLAEEVKSSPQRIQLFAQAAQAAVTSASSSISDITNSDLFSIGDNDGQQQRQNKPLSSPTSQHKSFQDVTLQSPAETMDFTQELSDGQRQRRLSNSSFASDISFRLPSYETPSTYHLQSDMEVSASEADDRGFSGGPATLDRVTKDQLYAAYKRTQERYKKYRTQYGDLARHYKLLERENAKARSVLVETQDKALRRISELKEQCTLEQSAKAHLEKALRVEIEEKIMKIEALNTKVQFLQSNAISDVDSKDDNANKRTIDKTENEVQLISLDNDSNINKNEDGGSETSILNTKIEKMEQLLNKYKESLKTSKEKNSQLTTELQMLAKELENKDKQIINLKCSEGQLQEAKAKIQELNSLNEELQNQINSFDFKKTKEMSTLELDLQKANDEMAELRSKIEVFNKREEEYAISLAENKLSIHKELEGKEAEIKSLKDNLSSSKKEIQSLKIVVDDYKNTISALEEEKIKLNNECADLNTFKKKVNEMDTKLQELTKKSQSLEQLKTKADEEYKCLQLQLKQETAEKLAMIDRNSYLETKNTQLSDENAKKNTKINHLENQLQVLSIDKNLENDLSLKESEKLQLLEEMNLWKEKCSKLELEIQEEREELVKLQTEIEKLLSNHELIQNQNAEFRMKITKLTSEYAQLQEDSLNYKSSIYLNMKNTLEELSELKKHIFETFNETKTTLESNGTFLSSLSGNINGVLDNSIRNLLKDLEIAKGKYDNLKLNYDKLQTTFASSDTEKAEYFNKIDRLRKDNDSLTIKIKDINENLQKSVNANDSAAENITLLNDKNRELTEKVKESEATNRKIQSMLDNEKAKYIAAAENVKIFEADVQNLNVAIQTLTSQNKSYSNEFEQLKCVREVMQNEIKEKEDIIKQLASEDQLRSDLLERMDQLKIENNQMSDTIKSLEETNNKLRIDVGELKKTHDATIVTLKDLNTEIHDKSVALEKLKQDQISLQDVAAQNAIACNTVSELENQNRDLKEKLSFSEDLNRQLRIELEEFNSKHKDLETQILEMNTILTNKSDECEAKSAEIDDLEDRILKLTNENISLKSETVNFNSNMKQLESEIEDIKISHAKIETEKDRLNRIIEELERKQKQESMTFKINQDSQTESINEDNTVKYEASAVLENKWVKEHQQTMSSTASLILGKENIEDIYEQYCTLKVNNDSLKDENRRLQSDIEGLQSYLTKISKENSVLNDKLRELIATSEHSTETDQLSSDVKELRDVIQVSKEKITDLQRENSLLIEENLELRDQLQSQSYEKPSESKSTSYNNKDLDTMKVKFDNLLQANGNLEKQNMDLEQINKSVNSNMQQLQEKNERLKLSNEKLERRLDEALVSLRHLHSLQENTELEYLRNILYEYLTGSGTHSITLAKVLAAIVKFDDVQTQLILQKERERQGFLRQLGII